MKTKFSKNGLSFEPTEHPEFGGVVYEYNGKKFETWKVSITGGASIGVFTWEVGAYKTRRSLSDRFNPEREVIGISY